MKMSIGAKSKLRECFSGLFYYTGYTQLCERIGAVARILCYHDISDSSPSRFSVCSQDFEKQMRHLATTFTVLSVDELVSAIRNRVHLPESAVAVTIDDGYKSVYTHAYPILKDYQIPATVFLPTAAIDGARPTHTQRRWVQGQFMGWKEVGILADERIRFGSHTINHVSLSILEPAQIRDEVRQSRAVIEEHTGQSVTGFAYPYGLPRDYCGIPWYVKEAGYSWAVTGVHGANGGHVDPYLLRRTKVERHDSLQVFDRLVRGAMDPWRIIDLVRR